MKRMFATKISRLVILLLAVTIMFSSNEANGQSDDGKFDFFLKLNAGILTNQNDIGSRFDPKVGASFGSYLTARYNFTRFGISTGIGVESFSFSQDLDFRIIPNEIGHSNILMNYLVLGIPILVHYSLADRFDIHGGVNLVCFNYMSLGIAGSGPRDADLNVNKNNNIPNWQFSQEAMVGLNYKLTDKLDVGLNVAKSLGSIQGIAVDMEFSSPDEDTYTVPGKFDYSWTRVNLELAYRFNK